MFADCEGEGDAEVGEVKTVKHGILHDYDLRANREKAAQGQTCVVCEAFPVTYQWSDYSGEAMCTQCGCPYQLKWGTVEQRQERAYPYLSVKEEWIHVLREYYDETHKFACLGLMMNISPEHAAFNTWAANRHPELFMEVADA